MKPRNTGAWVLAILLLVAPAGAFAKDINANAGTSAFPFLKINVGARAVAMGGAFTGLADDASSLYYNPAGIAVARDRAILGYHNYFVDMQSGFGGYLTHWGRNRTIGIYASYLNYGKILETDRVGTVLNDFSGGDLLLGVSVGMTKGYNWSFGGTAKLIYESVHDYSATGAAIDLGVRYAADRERYSFGLAIQNLGFQFSGLGTEKDKLPLTVRGGGAVHPRGLPLVISGDVIVPIDNDPYVAIGGEYLKLKPLYLRLGWNGFGSNYRVDGSEDNWAGFSFGAGFDYKKMQISYAFTPAADLGESHRITLTHNW